jgi:hypothetical protein
VISSHTIIVEEEKSKQDKAKPIENRGGKLRVPLG